MKIDISRIVTDGARAMARNHRLSWLVY